MDELEARVRLFEAIRSADGAGDLTIQAVVAGVNLVMADWKAKMQPSTDRDTYGILRELQKVGQNAA
jgi:hypothetical protein